MRRLLAFLLVAALVAALAAPGLAVATTPPHSLRYVRGQYGVDLFWKHDDGASVLNWYVQKDGTDSIVTPDWRADTQEWHIGTPLCETCTAEYAVRADTAGYSNTVSVPAYSAGGGDPPPGGGCTTAPAAPTISGTASGGSVSLSWSAVTGATSYRVYRNGLLVTTVAGTSWTGTYTVDGTDDIFTVRAVNDCGESSDSNSVSSGDTGGGSCVIAPPPTISGTASGGSVSLSWSEPVSTTPPTSYRVYRNGVQVAEVTGTTWNGTYPVDGTDDTFTVRSVNSCGESSDSNSVSSGDTGGGDPPPPGCTTFPAAPTISGTASGGTVTLTWGSVSGATSYVVKVWADGIWATVAEVTGTTWSGTYSGTFVDHYVVQAKNSCGLSPMSNEYQTPYEPPPPPPCSGPPAAPAVSAAWDMGTVVLTWSAVATANGYRIYADGVQVDTTTATSWTGTYALDGSPPVYTVRAYNDCGESEASNTAAASCSPLGSPATVTGKLDLGTAALSWSAVTGAKAYRVYRSSVRTGTVLVGTTTALTFTDSYPRDGTVWTYTVRAVNDCEEGTDSNPLEGSCLCSLKDYITGGAPIPAMPAMPTINRPPSTGRTVPTVPTIPRPPDVPAPPALPPIPEPSDTPWGLPRAPIGTPAAPGSPGGLLTPQPPLTPGGAVTAQPPLTPSAPGTPGGRLTPQTPLTPGGAVTAQPPLTPSAPGTPGGRLTPQTPLTPGGPLNPSAPLTPGGALTPAVPGSPEAPGTPQAAPTKAAPLTPQAPLTGAGALTPAGPGTPTSPMTPQPPMSPTTP